MSSFDTSRGIIILEPDQWDVLQRMLTGPLTQRANYAEGALAGLEDLGVINPYGPTPAARGILAGLMNSDARYLLRRLAPNDPLPVRDLAIALSSPTCTIARHDADGVHIYACDDIEVPHIALANDHLYPRPMVGDGPDAVYGTLAAAVRQGDINAAVTTMRTMGEYGPPGSTFTNDAETGQWSIVLRSRQDREGDGHTTTGQAMTLGTRNALYQILEEPGGATDPHGPSSTQYPLEPLLATDVWTTITPWLWATPS